MASHALGGLLAALALAGYFALTGAFGIATLVAAVSFLSPLCIALYLSRTGRLDRAHLLAAVQLSAIITLAAILSGGTASFALVWLILVPLEAALSASRRLLIAATGLAIANLAGLHIGTEAGILPPPIMLPIDISLIAFASHVAAALYAGAIVASIQRLHRSAARQLERSRAAYRLIAENTSDLVTRHDRHGEITFASLAAEPLLGIAPEALVRRGLAAALRPADAARCRDAIAQCLAIGSVASVELEIATDNAADMPRWVELRCQPLPSSLGTPGAIAVTRDITARKLHDLAMQKARDAAESASRAKSAFIATISHELRTPLNAIIGFSEMLNRDLTAKARDPRQAEYCRIIHDSGEHLMSLVKDLLDMSKLEAGKLAICAEPFHVEDVIRSSVDTLRPALAAKSIAIDVSIADGLDEMVADRRACKQMLINLLSNACKFTREGGRIEIGAAAAHGNVVLAVRDNGVGIAAAHVARLGEPFYQVDSSYTREIEGAGLGLAIVRGLVDLHHGRIEIESEVGKGSCFTLILPLDADAVPASGAVLPRPVALVA